MCKSSAKLGLVYKTFATEMTGGKKHLRKSVAAPEKTNSIHYSCNVGFFRKLNEVIFPSHPKTHSFRNIFLELVLCSAADEVEGRALALALVDVCSYRRNAHSRNSSLQYVMKGHARRKTFQNLDPSFKEISACLHFPVGIAPCTEAAFVEKQNGLISYGLLMNRNNTAFPWLLL